MLKISEHFEFYNSDHLSVFKGITDWESYYHKSVKEEHLFFGENKNKRCASIALSNESTSPFCSIKSSYYIGLDRFAYLGLNIYVEPKINNEKHQLNYIEMLLEALKEPENFNHLEGLVITEFNKDWIEIESHSSPLLTPFLIAQFLSVVKNLVRKGLKKSYYEKAENLNNCIKGKILVGKQIKQNNLKNRFTKTICRYQEFGVDTETNQFIKYVLSKISHHLNDYSQDSEIYINLIEILRYCQGGFHRVSNTKFKNHNYHENNPFYKNYNLAIQLGNQILALKDHNISKNSNNKKTLHPSFWIDMSKLFELFVFKKLKEHFPEENEVIYHQKHNRQEPDFIINTKNGIQAVVDAKYKPRYQTGNPSIDDARQLAGYTRLNSIYKELNIDPDVIIPAYFIYPANLSSTKQENNTSEIFENNFNEDAKLLFNEKLRLSSRYNKMYLQEIHLPSH
ncbi:5-methylcytosine restriction system specificity protein McrC [Elizabethkingia miricola]|uniref:5-methylcytosine restriction system specificity protein McrC n=1 Tax=Elizabethkingia miricola TaxID=172045 RepID=UPI003891E9DD